MDAEIIAEGLGFPEGPIAMADGSVILVEIRRGALTRVWGGGKSEVIATLGGGPNGAAIGPDGAVYVCNNGGFRWFERDGVVIPHGTPDDYSGGRIERVDLSTGKVERVYDRCGEFALRGPNDIVFASDGSMWFSDYGKDAPRQRDKGGLYWAKADGSQIVEVEFGGSGYNGIGLSPDEKTLYAAETTAGRLWAFEITGPGQVNRKQRGRFAGRVVAGMPGMHYFDSLAVTEAGNVCVATVVESGITTIAPDGTWRHDATPDMYTTNICFGGADMRDAYITLSGTGKLAKVRWPEPGLKLAFNG
jgi:gluconolactonase